MGHEKGEPLSLVGINKGDNPEGPLTLEERDKALKDIATIHRNTGHGPLEHLVRALEARKTDPRIVQLAREYRCDVCRECSRRVPRPQVSLEPLPPKWKALQADNAYWIHPHSGERVQFTLLIDEGCRFRIGKIMSVGKGSGVKAKDLVSFFQEQWKPVFGKPDKVRLDPAGSWRSNEVSEYFENIHVEVDVIPAEAHWNTSHVERAIQATKHVMYRLAAEDPQITAAEALSEAIRVENEREVVRGYSPAQHALGRAPDAAGRFFESEHLEVPPLLCENGNGEYRRNVERMRNAEQAFSEWVANERIKRAKNTRTYQVTSYAPGDLVYVWRVQTKGPGSAGRTGGFTGPARVLALETRLTAEGNYRPGSVVWLVRGSRLIKAVPEQLRKASVREECMEELINPPNLPWTFTKLADDIGVRQYDDVTDEVPNVMEYEQGVDEETMRPFKRIRSKRTVPECPPPTEAASSSGGQAQATLAVKHQHVWEDMPEHFQDEYAQSFWAQETAAVEVEIGMPETKRGWRHLGDNFESYLTSQIRKRAIEVNERYLNPEEKQKMTEAKQVEIKNFISAKALEAIPTHLQPDKQTAMRMRWILTWKRDEAGGQKAKARCVILGYMDPQYEHRQVASPTMTRTSRQVMLAVSASLGFGVWKGDVSGAFLQGREYQGESFVIPTDDICDAMGIPAGSVTRLKKACYGLVDAPLEWFLTVSEFLVSIGFEKCVCDPCCFKFVENGILIGLVGGHVDDFLFCGLSGCKTWERLCQKIQERFKWGTWEKDNFIQCGVEISRLPCGGFSLGQTQYIDDLKEIQINAERRRQPKSATSDLEKTRLRAALGALAWSAQQTCPHIAAGVSLLLSQVNSSTIETLIETNKLIYKTKCQRKHKLIIHGGIGMHDTLIAGWADAAAQNRVDGKSTQGIFIGITSKSLLTGQLCKVSPVSWSSSKIGRQCRSPGAAESLAAINCEDIMYAVRLQYYEMSGNKVHVRDTERQVSKVAGVLVTDSTNVYDRMKTEIYVPKGPENRVALEMLGLKEALVNTKLPVRWVNSDAQLANSMTKDHEHHQIQRFYHLGQCWKIVDDPKMMSAKNRKKQGLDPLDEKENNQPVARNFQDVENLRGPGDVGLSSSHPTDLALT